LFKIYISIGLNEEMNIFCCAKERI